MVRRHSYQRTSREVVFILAVLTEIIVWGSGLGLPGAVGHGQPLVTRLGYGLVLALINSFRDSFSNITASSSTLRTVLLFLNVLVIILIPLADIGQLCGE